MSYADQLYEYFLPYQNSQDAQAMSQYMRSQFEFLGIRSPQRKQLLADFLRIYPLPQKDIFFQNIEELWQMSPREFQYLAIDLTQKYAKNLEIKDLAILEFMLTQKSWWDSVDAIHPILGVFFQKFEAIAWQTTKKWIDSKNIWLQRSAVIFQLSYKQKTDWQLLQRNILLLAHSQEFFVQKAIGWALRQYARQDGQAVLQFLEANPLSPLSHREARKHL